MVSLKTSNKKLAFEIAPDVYILPNDNPHLRRPTVVNGIRIAIPQQGSRKSRRKLQEAADLIPDDTR
jgi:hypothetical protein